ncbi:MAG: M23 family metallopeptidase [Lysobacterales bacterium]
MIDRLCARGLLLAIGMTCAAATVALAADAPGDAEGLVSLRVESEGPKRTYFATPKRPGHIEIELRLVDARNVHAIPALPLRTVLSGERARQVVALLPANIALESSYGLGLKALPGRPLARAAVLPFAYRRPLPVHVRAAVGQGAGGPTHRQPQSFHAMDFEVPDGTTVVAARAGQVIDVVMGFEGGGLRPEFDGKANLIRIEHADGTMALYVHLATRSAIVRIGDRVVAGQPLAKSGHTGYATGPHLHFAVQINQDFSLVSIPFELDRPIRR